MQCPRCGADNSPQADQCSLCEYPFSASGIIESEADTPTGPDVPPQAAYTQAPPPGATPGQPQMPAQPPPQGPPRFYPPGYQAPPPSGMSKNMKILIGAGIFLGILVLVAVFALMYFGTTPTIKVTTPPGWQIAGQEETDDFEELISQEDEDVDIDYLFTDGTLNNFVAIAHGRAYIMDSPDSENFEDVEDFFMEHKGEIESEIKSAYQMEGIVANLTDYRVGEMASGVASLYMSLSISGQGMTVYQDFMFFFKDDTMFFVVISTVGTGGNQEVIDFLTENISFE